MMESIIPRMLHQREQIIKDKTITTKNQVVVDKKTIWCFGDSWMYGQGSQFEPGSGILPTFVKYDPKYEPERNKYSIPARLKNLINDDSCEILNLASSGTSNFQIYSDIIKNINCNKVKKDDIVIVLWTSVLREALTYFTDGTNEFTLNNSIFFSLKWLAPHGDRLPQHIKDLKDSKLRDIHTKTFEDWIVNRINLDFFHEICMNYICNLQILFDSLEVKYIFGNAFENVISETVPFHNEIKQEKWLNWNTTFSDYLCDLEPTLDQSLPYTLWEDDFKYPGRNHDGPHPNRIGYGLIAEKIYEHLKERIL